MKKMEVLRKIDEVVKRYTDTGWFHYWGNSSFGYEFMVELTDGSKKLRIYAEERSTFNPEFQADILTVRVVEMKLEQTFETEADVTVYDSKFYKIARDWYTESVDETKKAWNARRQHYKNSYDYSYGARDHAVSVSEDLLKMLKARKGFEKATIKNTKACRYPDHYTVKTVNRIGNVVASVIFRAKNI